MCTLEKRGSLYILTLTGSDEHRLNPTLIDAIQSALLRVKAETATSSSALITTAEGKFFCNGLDLAWVQSTESNRQLLGQKLQSLIHVLITLPMPTIAAISGHVSAAGVLLALSYDYILMRKDRGFLYMSELDIGMTIPPKYMALLKRKVGDPMARREMLLKAAKLTAKEAVGRGIIDAAYDSVDETVRAAVELGEELVKRQWDGHVYAQNRFVVSREVIEKFEFHGTVNGVEGIRSRL